MSAYHQIDTTSNSDSGIGAAVAHNLAAKGCTLVLNYTSDSSTEITKKLAKVLEETHGITALPCQADMGDPAGPAHIVTTAKNHFSHPKTGKFQIDIVVNNAGVSHIATVDEVTAEDFTRVMAINALGPLLLIKAVHLYLPNDRSGRIVNVSSVASTEGFEKSAIYGGSKAALDAFTRTWARELAERATVNSINPGPVATDMYKDMAGSWVEDMMRPFY